MATPTKHPAARIPAGQLGSNKTATGPSGGGAAAGAEWTAEDRKLLAYVRTNAQPIVAALTRTSSEAGFRRDYGDMHEYLEIATKIADLCRIEQPMAAAAGR